MQAAGEADCSFLEELMSHPGLEPAVRPPKTKVVVLLGSPFLYGMERSVIELFDKLRPEVDSHFVLTYTAFRQQLPILQEIEARRLPHSFLPDKREWPRIGKPHSLGDAWRLCVSVVRGNLCLLRAAFGKDALYVPSLLGAFHCVLAALYMRMRRRRVIYHFHDLPHQRSMTLSLWTLLVTDFVHNTRVAYETAVRTNSFVLRKRNLITPQLLDLPRADNGGASDASATAKREIFFVGQVSPHKGIELLLDAFQALHPGSACLNIVGAAQPEYQARFEELLRQCPAACDIRVLGYQSNVLEYLNSAYLYVHPSPPSCTWESYGRGVLEAMSRGVPVVCYRSGSLQEIVVNEETGIVCEEESSRCLADAIERFLADPGFRDRCGINARERYKRLYSPEVVRTTWVRFFCMDS
jgi:glycosyltransferase involved in cell wall biosynthesis